MCSPYSQKAVSDAIQPHRSGGPHADFVVMVTVGYIPKDFTLSLIGNALAKHCYLHFLLMVSGTVLGVRVGYWWRDSSTPMPVKRISQFSLS